MGLGDRLKRQFARQGIGTVLASEDLEAHDGCVILVRADAVIDQPLVSILIERERFVLIGEGPDGDEVPLAAHIAAADVPAVRDALAHGRNLPTTLGVATAAPGELDTAFWASLRKREIPYALVVDDRNKAHVEWRMFMGTYKGATDFITKHLWPRPAFHVTRILAPLGVSPNMVTLVAALLVVAAFFLFLEGQWAAGLAAAWLMTFLDTVDGKLARVTLTSSKWGDAFDHGIDLIHPPFWYVAWGLGLSTAGLALSPDVLAWTLGLIIGGYVLQRAMEGIAIKAFRLEIHIWRPIDTAFRQITARRNPNLVILTASVIAGRPDWGLLAVAAWTVVCLVLHGVQLLQAIRAKRRNGTLQSWMSEPVGRP